MARLRTPHRTGLAGDPVGGGKVEIAYRNKCEFESGAANSCRPIVDEIARIGCYAMFFWGKVGEMCRGEVGACPHNHAQIILE